MCKEVAWEGIAYEGGMQWTLCIWDKCIGYKCINVSVREVKSDSEVGKK